MATKPLLIFHMVCPFLRSRVCVVPKLCVVYHRGMLYYVFIRWFMLHVFAHINALHALAAAAPRVIYVKEIRFMDLYI